MELLTKEQVIEVLEKALANPRYLGNGSNGSNSTKFFCSSILMVLLDDPFLTFNEADERASFIQNTYVYPSINECLFLKSHLFAIGAIPLGTITNSAVYKAAAHKHWAKLIESLKQEGETA